MMTTLFFNWYEEPSRQHEIDKCLEMNRKVFDDVVIIRGRPTFAEMFDRGRYAEINCFCNSDIYFTDLTLLDKLTERVCFAITRDDLRNTNYAPGSQDAWCFMGKPKVDGGNFTQGLWGCDNRLAYEITLSGYTVLNPPIPLTHLHAVDNRDQQRTKLNTVPPPYKLIPPLPSL